MRTRIVELDLEAYEALAREAKPGETFSEVIKSRFGRRKTAAALLRAAADAGISAETLDAVDEVIRARGESPATAAEL